MGFGADDRHSVFLSQSSAFVFFILFYLFLWCNLWNGSRIEAVTREIISLPTCVWISDGLPRSQHKGNLAQKLGELKNKTDRGPGSSRSTFFFFFFLFLWHIKTYHVHLYTRARGSMPDSRISDKCRRSTAYGVQPEYHSQSGLCKMSTCSRSFRWSRVIVWDLGSSGFSSAEP